MASIVRRGLGGEQVYGFGPGEDMALSRITDEEIRRSRALEMYRMHRAGIPVPKIAKKYRLSRGYVYQELRTIPEWQRDRANAFRLSVG